MSVRYTWALIAGIVLHTPAIAEVTVHLVRDPQPHIAVSGLPGPLLDRLKKELPDRAAWQRILALYVDDKTDRLATPVLGDYTISREGLVFTPRFPLKPGLQYRAVFDPVGLPVKPSPARRRIEAFVSLPALAPAQPTVVDAVYPKCDVLPENHLKFYIHFSAPMSRGDSYQHIQLLDEHAKPVEAPFLELSEELWDESGKRLTLLLDPGRVKQDLKPHKEVGRALVDANSYTLVIDEGWRDARGAPLVSEFRKSFRVTQADLRQPDPRRWKISPPSAGTRDPLVVRFDEPLDHALLQHMIRVSSPTRKFLDGRVTIDRQETCWSFQPESSWSAGQHRLLVDGTLEDLAGNSITRPFEVYLPTSRPAETNQYTVPFRIDRATNNATEPVK